MFWGELMSKKYIEKYLASILAVLCALPSLAVSEQLPLVLDEAIQGALNGSPIVKDIEARFNMQRASSFEANVLSNPELDTEVGVPSAWEDKKGKNEIAIGITQPIKFSQGALRNRLSSLIREAGSRDKEKDILSLITKVRFAFARTWVVSERSRILNEVLPEARSLSQFVKKGLGDGAYGKGEEAVFRAEVAKTEAELKGVLAESLNAFSELSQLSGFNIEARKVSVPALLPLMPLESLETRLMNGEIKVQSRAKLLLELSEADLSVARRDRFPELRPRLFYQKTNEGVDIVGVGLSFPLPFYSQNTAEVMRKDAERSVAQAKVSFFQGEVFRTSMLRSVKAYSLRREEVLAYENKVLPGLREALTAFESQVRDGQGSIFQLWQTLREYVDAQERYLELWTQTFSERIELAIILEEDI